MSRSHALFDQCYECGDKKFHNIWQAFDYQKQTGHFPQYRFDKEFIDSIKNIKRPKNLSHQYIKNLIVTSLKKLRSQHKYLRLALGGGTDSYSILKYCVKNDIYLDEVFTYMVSIDHNAVRSNIEYLPAINYAKQHVGTTIGQVSLLHPTIKDYECVFEKGWLKNPNYVRGSQLPGRITNAVSRWYNKTNFPLDESLTIFGLDKPHIQNIDGKMYWVQTDANIADIMGCKNALPLFFDKHNPELSVAMTYALLENSDTSMSFINYGSQTKDKRSKIITSMGLESTGHYYIDHHLLGKSMFDNQSIKSLRAKKELIKLNRKDIINAFKKTTYKCIKEYGDLPHALEIKNQISIKAVKRFSQKIPIYQHSFGS